MTTTNRKNSKAIGDFVLVGEKYGVKPFPITDPFYQGILKQAVKQVTAKE